MPQQKQKLVTSLRKGSATVLPRNAWSISHLVEEEEEEAAAVVE